jgi:Domain of unknown function (DUF4082)
MRTRLPLAIAVFLCLAAGWLNSASATPILTGGSETLTSAQWSPNLTIGFDFVSTVNQSITALGFWDSASNGLPQGFDVGLWDTATQSLMASATIDNTDPLDASLTVAGGQWRYEALGVPVALLSGHTYALGWETGSSTMSAADSLIIDVPTVTSAPTVTLVTGTAAIRYALSSSLVFPSLIDIPNSDFPGNVNAQLGPVTSSPVPEPATLILFGTSPIGVGVHRYQRQR